MANMNLTSGISTCIIPESVITPEIYGLLRSDTIGAVEIGYEHTGPALANPVRYERLIETARYSPPRICSIHAPYHPDRDISTLDETRRLTAVIRTEESLVLAQRLGVDLVVLHGSQDPIDPGMRPMRLSQARKSLAALMNAARQIQVRLALEMMPPEWLPAGTEEAQAMLEDLDPEVIGFCLDTNHANLTGDLCDIVRSLDRRMWHIHLSDNDGQKQRHWMPFQGIIDWQAFMNALIEVDYHGVIVYELDPHPDGLPTALADITANFDRLLSFVRSAS